MDSQTYLTESARTVSTHFYPESVPAAYLHDLLQAIIAVGDRADAVKKTLFYGAALPANRPPVAPDLLGPTLTPEGVEPALLHAVLGLVTESAELLQALTVALHGGPLDEVNLVEEAGDLEWYLALLYRTLGRTPQDAKALNIAKLRQRYPERFDAGRAHDRDLTAERAILAGATA